MTLALRRNLINISSLLFPVSITLYIFLKQILVSYVYQAVPQLEDYMSGC